MPRRRPGSLSPGWTRTPRSCPSSPRARSTPASASVRWCACSRPSTRWAFSRTSCWRRPSAAFATRSPLCASATFPNTRPATGAASRRSRSSRSSPRSRTTPPPTPIGSGRGSAPSPRWQRRSTPTASTGSSPRCTTSRCCCTRCVPFTSWRRRAPRFRAACAPRQSGSLVPSRRR